MGLEAAVTAFRLKLYPRDYIAVRTFYEQILGFPIVGEWDRGEHDRGAMFGVGPAVLELLAPEKEYQPVTGADISLEVSNVQALWEQLQDQAEVVFALRDNDWGDSSFCIKDPEGFEITFFTKRTDFDSAKELSGQE
jgi:catechol 2,3-dioxygenase-like lactoylglutathione lyase family enzyme